jgi:hypothetical protein
VVKAHPDCPNDPATCRISVVNSSSTAVAWAPVYDGNGVIINGDPSTYVTTFRCDTCAMSWEERRTGEDVTVTKQERI